LRVFRNADNEPLSRFQGRRGPSSGPCRCGIVSRRPLRLRVQVEAGPARSWMACAPHAAAEVPGRNRSRMSRYSSSSPSRSWDLQVLEPAPDLGPGGRSPCPARSLICLHLPGRRTRAAFRLASLLAPCASSSAQGRPLAWPAGPSTFGVTALARAGRALDADLRLEGRQVTSPRVRRPRGVIM